MNRIVDKLAAWAAREPKTAAVALLITSAGWALAGLAFLAK